jgi:hypothetical protein
VIGTIFETLLTLAQVAEEHPRRRKDRKTHVSTLYRWSIAGCRGVRLETIQIGGTRCTSQQVLQRFFEKLSQSHPGRSGGGQGGPTVCGRSEARCQRSQGRPGSVLRRWELNWSPSP